MKTFLFASLVLGAQILVFDWGMTRGSDDFTLTPAGHKVFHYGFPFQIADSGDASLSTPTPKKVLLWAANFATVSFIFLTVMLSLRWGLEKIPEKTKSGSG